MSHTKDHDSEILKVLRQIERNTEQTLLATEYTARATREILQISQANMGYLADIDAQFHRTTFPTQISFKETSMLDPVAGNTLVYTGTLTPAGAVYPSGAIFSLQSSDPTVNPTVDATGLVVTIVLPSTFVDDPNNPFNVVYTATSADGTQSITATITPSVPAATFPTGITFAQTT